MRFAFPFLLLSGGGGGGGGGIAEHDTEMNARVEKEKKKAFKNVLN